MEEDKSSIITKDFSSSSSPASTPSVDLGAHAAKSIIQHERAYLLATIAVFVLIAVYKALTTPLWFDEFFTLFLSRLPSNGGLLRAIPADGQPPLQYMLSHLSWAWLGISVFSIRLPDILAYLAVGLLAYRIVRRHGTAVQALFAVAVALGCDTNAHQAYTARPYELVLAFIALVYACWQVAASRNNNRFLPLCGMTIGIAGAVLSHHFGVIFAGLMLGTGEAVRFYQRRRLDWRMLLAIAAGLLPLAITLPLAQRSHVLLGEPVMHSKNFCCGPHPIDVISYLWMVPPLLVLSIIVLATFVRHPDHPASGPDSTPPPVPAHEWAATAALCLLVPVQIALAYTATNYFLIRYAIPASLGLALLGGWGLPRVRALRGTAQSIISLATLGFLLFVTARLVFEQAYNPVWRPELRKKAVSKLLLAAPGNLPVVIANAFDFAPDWWYSPPSLRRRLIYLSDMPYAETQRDFLPELSLDLDKAYTPLPSVNYASFLKNNSRFLLLCTGAPPKYWLPKRLPHAGRQLQPIARSGKGVLYLVSPAH